MLKRMKYLLLLPLTAIVSCGYSTSYLVEGNKYVSPVFKENYYTHWDDELKTARKVSVVDVSEEAYIHSYPFSQGTSRLDGFSVIDPNYIDSPIMEDYGADNKMSGVDESFRYGYQSKMFDGQMVCGAQNGKDGTNGSVDYSYEKGRVQIKESGFSIRFSKESDKLHYFAMQFKASTDYKRKWYLINGNEYEVQNGNALRHQSKFDLIVTLYKKDNHDIVGYPFKINIEFSESTTNNGSYYKFLAFNLEQYDISRLIGASVIFTVKEDALIDYNLTKEIPASERPSYAEDYALFLYEMFFPYTSWN